MRVRTEAVTLAPVELLDGAGEANVAFLDQVQQWYSAAQVLARHAHHQAQVGLRELATGLFTLRHRLLKSDAICFGQVGAVLQEAARPVARLDQPGEFDLLFGGEQCDC